MNYQRKEKQLAQMQSENYLYSPSEDFNFIEEAACNNIVIMESLKWKQAFDGHMYPFGDWRDLCCSKTNRWSLSTVSIQSVESKAETSQYIYPNLVGKFMKVFRVQKVKINPALKYHPNSEKTTDLNDTSFDESNIKVENLFNYESSQKSSCRRDVIIKSILRYFQKFFKHLFQDLVRKEIQSRTMQRFRGLSSFRQHITVSDIKRVLMKLKLITNMDSPDLCENMENEVLTNFVRSLLKQSKGFDESVSNVSQKSESEISTQKSNAYFIDSETNPNSPVKVMNELLYRYSHYKLQKFFENCTLRRLFLYFKEFGMQNLIESFSQGKKSILLEALEDFDTNFSKYNN